MKILYFLSHDGNNRFITESKKEAAEWEEAQQLNQATEIYYDENFAITHINGNEIDWTVETISDEIGTPEFERVKTSIQIEYAFPESMK